MKKLKTHSTLDEKQKRTIVVVAFFIIYISLVVFINMEEKSPDALLKVEFSDTHICKETIKGFEPAEVFFVGEKVFLCTEITLSQVGKSTQVRIKLFKDRVKKANEYYWSSLVTTGEGRKTFSVNVDLLPSHYCLQLIMPRSIPFESCFDVIEK